MPRVSASSFVAMMGDDMEVLGGKGEDERREIASLTKIMTAYTVICICNSYGIKVREHKLTILQQASFIEGTSANLRPDEQLSVMDLLYGLLLPSGNDAGVALAQYFGKFLSFKFAKDNREEEWLEKFKSLKEFYDCNYQRESIKLFVFEMNKHSHSIGLRNTHFANPTGLSNSKNYSSARDIALLTAHCLRNHLMREIFRKKVYVCTATNERLSYARYRSSQVGKSSGKTPTNIFTNFESASESKLESPPLPDHASAPPIES